MFYFGALDGLDEERLKLVPRPLDAVVDEVREVAQRAHGDATAFRCFPTIPVGLGLKRHDGIHVARSAHGALHFFKKVNTMHHKIASGLKKKNYNNNAKF